MSPVAEGLESFVDIVYLTPENTVFEMSKGGFLSLKIGDKKYDRVHLYRIFPLRMERQYISVRDMEEKEIGLIRSLDVFPKDTVELFEMDLDRRYFVPRIQRVVTIKEEFGYYYWTADTTAGRRNFIIRGNRDALISLQENHILIIDVDGNRFEIPDYKALDDKTERIIESLI